MQTTLAASKPLMRGWSHAAAAVWAVALTLALCWRTWGDWPGLVSVLVFGLSMVELYTVSAVYHMGSWRQRVRRVLRSLDHANIFVLIAGTYTPVCFYLLDGWVRVAMLITIWVLAVAGVGLSVLTLHFPRQLTAGLYIAMGWVAVLALPAFVQAIGWGPLSLFVLGGVLYTIGAVIYARRRPDPFPRVFGFHEVFHLFVIAGGVVFAIVVWIWVVPFPRG